MNWRRRKTGCARRSAIIPPREGQERLVGLVQVPVEQEISLSWQ